MSYEQAAAERLLNHHGDADAPTRYAKRRASALGGGRQWRPVGLGANSQRCTAVGSA